MDKQTTTARTFNAETVQVRERCINHTKIPCVNVKVRHGFEAISPEEWRELASMAGEMDSTADGNKFTREWLENWRDNDAGDTFDELWNSACASNFEIAEEEAKALFGDDIKVTLEGRSNGWLCVAGLPDVEEWDRSPLEPHDLPSLKDSPVEGACFHDGTRLTDDANLFERWAFFSEACEGYAKDVPNTCAGLIALNVFPQEEGTRPVEFLRAKLDHTWDTFTLPIPRRLSGEAAVEYAIEQLNTNNPMPPVPLKQSPLIVVYNDPI
jgi:hypothetical protein